MIYEPYERYVSLEVSIQDAKITRKSWAVYFFINISMWFLLNHEKFDGTNIYDTTPASQINANERAFLDVFRIFIEHWVKALRSLKEILRSYIIQKVAVRRFFPLHQTWDRFGALTHFNPRHVLYHKDVGEMREIFDRAKNQTTFLVEFVLGGGGS